MVKPANAIESTVQAQVVKKKESSHASRNWKMIKACSTGMALKVMGVAFLYLLARANAEAANVAEPMTWSVSCSFDFSYGYVGAGAVTIPLNEHTQKYIVEPYLNSSIAFQDRNCVLYNQLLKNGPDLSNFTFQTPLVDSSPASVLEVAGLIQLLVFGALFF